MGGNSDGLLGQGSATLDRLGNLLLFIGLPIAIISFFKGFYPKGSVSRLAFALVVVALICIWIFIAALGGHISVLMELLGSSIHFNLNFETLLWLFIIAAALWGIYWAVEVFIYRNDWKQNGFMPVDDTLRRKQRHQRNEMENEERSREKDERARQKEGGTPPQSLPPSGYPQYQQSGPQTSEPYQPPQGPKPGP